jgi:hypothetical protein
LGEVNINGGAIAIGHPRSAAPSHDTWLHNLQQAGGRYGLQVMCKAGGPANATIMVESGGLGAVGRVVSALGEVRSTTHCDPLRRVGQSWIPSMSTRTWRGPRKIWLGRYDWHGWRA